MKPSNNLAERLEAATMRITESGCWIWMKGTTKGYGQLTFDYQHMHAHRASWTVHRGPIPDGMHVLHRCNVSYCINPDHLYLGTDKENAADRIAIGTQPIPPRMIGEDHPNAKITLVIAREIKAASGTIDSIAKKFGVSFSTAQAIRSGRLWRHA